MNYNIENRGNVDSQDLASSYVAMEAAAAYGVNDPLGDLRYKRAALLKESCGTLGNLFRLQGDPRVVENQRKGMRKRLADIYKELDENYDPVPEFNGCFTAEYQQAAIALAQKPGATHEQKAEANVIQYQNTLIAEKRFDEFPKAPETLSPAELESDIYFSSYLKDIARRHQSDTRSRRTSQSVPGSQKEGFFKRAVGKIGSAWKAVKGWFGR